MASKKKPAKAAKKTESTETKKDLVVYVLARRCIDVADYMVEIGGVYSSMELARAAGKKMSPGILKTEALVVLTYKLNPTGKE